MLWYVRVYYKINPSKNGIFFLIHAHHMYQKMFVKNMKRVISATATDINAMQYPKA